ncbi:hypothetical protein [Pseudalkalibacillus sp. SCS-8]|uniref:hypothetical protein n=1 Tax=Pseudalkalibacillus nanhaiensis TaxID=3115291 RepID=UPI0032DAE56D
MAKRLGIGWDVGGWMGTKQGIAAAYFDSSTDTFSWIGQPRNTNIKHHKEWSPEGIIDALDSSVSLDDFEDIVVAIDASLGFPLKFQQLVNMSKSELDIPPKEIYNPFAYRETERHIFEKFNKKPLSATFDKLGNNTTLALSYALSWTANHDFKIIPQQGSNDESRSIIEVYPALIKESEQGFKKEGLLDLIPADLPKKSDAYDASICALLALLFKGNGDLIENVMLTHPPDEFPYVKEEGWIYYI